MNGEVILKGIINKDDINNEERIFGAFASVSIIDRQGDFISMEEFKPALQKIMSSGRKIQIHDSHTNHPCGEILSYSFKTEPNSGKEGLYITARIYKDYDTDTIIWGKIKDGSFTGISLGGRAGDKQPVCNESQCYNILTDIEIWEFSIVETPANQSALIDSVNKLAKSFKEKNPILKYIIYKAKAYVKKPLDAPAGVKVHTGSDGGFYYNTEDNYDHSSPHSKIRLHRSNDAPQGVKVREDEDGFYYNSDDIKKAKVYIKNPSEAPQGVKVQEGKRGGHYYESDQIEEHNEPKSEELEQYNKINNLILESEKTEDINKLSEIAKLLAIEVSEGKIKELKLYEESGGDLGHFAQGVVFVTSNIDKNSAITWIPASIGEDPLKGRYLETKRKIPQMVETAIHEGFHQRFVNNSMKGHEAINKLKALNYGGDEFEELIRLATVYTIDPQQLKNESPESYKVVSDWILSPKSESVNTEKPQQDNIEIITGDIKNKNILDSLEDFSKEGNIEAVPPPSKEEVQSWIKESGIPKDRKVVVIPFFSETVNAYNYMGEDTIFLLSNNLELDKEILEETRTEIFKAGYNIKECTFENRRLGSIVHEEGHIQTYKKAGITSSSEKDSARLHYTFKEYEEFIMKHFEKDTNTIFDYEILLEILAEDFRINKGGKGGSFPHRYFYKDDIDNPQFKQERAGILRKIGMI